jgi:hypothetical protein
LKINGKNQGVYYQILDWGDKNIFSVIKKDSQGALYTLRDVENTFDDNDVKYKYLAYWRKYSNANSDDYSDLKVLLDLINNPSDEYFYQKIGEIVDLNNFYNWNAFNFVSGNSHQELSNTKLYFNPETKKFEFIPWDVFFHAAPEIESELYYDKLVVRILSNPKFLNERNKIIIQYVKDENNLIDDLAYLDQIYQKTKMDFLRDETKYENNFEYQSAVKNLKQRIIENFHNAQNYLQQNTVNVEINYNLTKETTLKITNTGFGAANFKDLSIAVKDNFKPDLIELYSDSNNNQSLDQADKLLAEFSFDQNSMILKAENVNDLIYSRKDKYVNSDNYLDLKIVPESKIYFIKNLKAESLSAKNFKFNIVNEFSGKEISLDINFY